LATNNAYTIHIGVTLEPRAAQKIEEEIKRLIASQNLKISVDITEAMENLVILKDELNEIKAIIGSIRQDAAGGFLNFEFDPNNNAVKFHQSLQNITREISKLQSASKGQISKWIDSGALTDAYKAVETVVEQYNKLSESMSGDKLKGVMSSAFDFSKLGFDFDDLVNKDFSTLLSKTLLKKGYSLDTFKGATLSPEVEELRSLAQDGIVIGIDETAFKDLLIRLKDAQYDVKKISTVTRIKPADDDHDEPYEDISAIKVEAVDRATGNIETKMFSINAEGTRFEEIASKIVVDLTAAAREADRLTKIMDANQAYAAKQESILQSAESAAYHQAKPIKGSYKTDLETEAQSIRKLISECLEATKVTGE